MLNHLKSVADRHLKSLQGHFAMMTNNFDLLVTLVQDEQYTLPPGILHYAARHGNTMLIDAVLANNDFALTVAPVATINHFYDGSSPLMLSALCNHIDAVKHLINKGATVDAERTHESNRGATALHFAASCNYDEIVRSLVNAGADINKQTLEDDNCNPGNTPLMVACSRSNTNIAMLLLDLGADPNIENKDGEKALDLIKDLVTKNLIVKKIENLKPQGQHITHTRSVTLQSKIKAPKPRRQTKDNGGGRGQVVELVSFSCT